MKASVSVVIPARDAEGTIAAQLDALAEQVVDDAVEVIVADNGSTDGTAALAATYAERIPRLRVVDASHRTGINAARNAGVRAADGERVLLCDADDVIAPGWIVALSGALDDLDIAGGPLDEGPLNSRESIQVRSPLATGELPVGGDFLPYAVGANLGFRRTVWESLGGFDEHWVRGGTEVEFCWRAQLAGHRIGFVPGAVVAYRNRESARESFRQAMTFARGQARLYRTFRHAGMPRTHMRRALRMWLWLAVHLPDLRSAERRETWLRLFARRSGYLLGSLRHRVLYL